MRIALPHACKQAAPFLHPAIHGLQPFAIELGDYFSSSFYGIRGVESRVRKWGGLV
jgi:hypothetical protein